MYLSKNPLSEQAILADQKFFAVSFYHLLAFPCFLLPTISLDGGAVDHHWPTYKANSSLKRKFYI
jgi:hypothetical protein